MNYDQLYEERQRKRLLSQLDDIPDDFVAQAPTAEVSSPKAKEEPGMLSSIGTGVAKGVNQAGKNLFNAIDDAGNWLNNNVVNLRTKSQQAEYERLQAANTKVGTEVFQSGVDYWNDGTTANQVSADISEFLIGFIPAMRVEGALVGGFAKGAGIKGATSKTGKLAQTAASGAVAGAAASATTVNPDATNLSSLVENHFPSLSNPITQYLQTSPDDSAGEKRFKQAMDSVLSGVVAAPIVEGLAHAVRAFRAKKITEGVDPAKEFKEAVDTSVQERIDRLTGVSTSRPLTMEERVGLENQFNAKRTPKDVPTNPYVEGYQHSATVAEDGTITFGGKGTPVDSPTIESILAKTEPLTQSENAVLRAYVDLQEKAMEQAGIVVEKSGTRSPDMAQTAQEILALIKKNNDAFEAGVRNNIADFGKSADKQSLIEAGKLNPDGTLNLSAFKSQAGFFDPELFARVLVGSSRGEIGSSLLGAAAGASQADWNDPRNVLGMAALGSIGGRALFRMRSPQEIQQLRREAPTTVTMATRPGLDSVRPKEFVANPKGIPLRKDGVARLATKVRDGSFEKITAEDLGEMPGLIRNIDTEDDIKKLLAETYNSIYDKSVRSWDEVIANSEGLKNLGTVTALFKQTKNLDAGVHAARTVLTASAMELKSLAKQVGDIEKGLGNFVSVEERAATLDALVLAFEKQNKLHSALSAQVFGASSEIGRALAAHRIMVKEEAAMSAELKAMIEQAGGRGKLVKLAKALDGVDHPAAISKAVEAGLLTRLGNAALYSRLTGMLWSPVTQTKNILGSIIKAGMLVGEKEIQAAIGAVRGGPDRVTFEEAHEFAYGFWAGMKDAIQYIRTEGLNAQGGLLSNQKINTGLYTAVAGDKGFKPTYLNTVAQDSSYGHTLGNNPWADIIRNPTSEFGQNMQKAFDYMGAIQGANLSFMGATDSFFQALNYRASLHASALRTARSKGLTGDALETEIARLIDSPTKEMAEKGMADALDATFQKQLDPSSGAWLDKLGHHINSARHSMPWLSVIFPFVKTPTNIMRDVLDRIPLSNAVIGGAAAENRRILAEGGIEADKLIARWTMGATLLTGASYLAYNGTLIGGQEYDKNGLKQLAGIQQYSLKIGDKTYSINGIDPVGMFFGLAADVTEALKKGETETATQMLGVGLTAITKNLLSKSYATSLFETADMLNDVMRKNPAQGAQAFEKWVQKNSTSFVPFGGILKNIEGQVDPVVRDYNDWKERFKANLPGVSDSLYPKRNVLTGEPLKNEGAWGPDFMSPFYTKTLDKSPIVQELLRLNVAVDPMDKYLDKNDKLTKLSPEQYDRLQLLATQEIKIAGKTMMEALNDMVTSPTWELRPDGQEGFKGLKGTKESYIKATIERYRDKAEKALIAEDEKVQELAKQHKVNKLFARQGKPVVKELIPQ